MIPDYYENKLACVMVEFRLEEEAVCAKVDELFPSSILQFFIAQEDLDGILLGAARIKVAYTKKQL